MRLTLAQRRRAFLGLLGVAGVAFLVALVATLAAWPSTGTLLIVALVVLALTLIGEIVLLVWGEAREFDEGGEWYEWEAERDDGDEIVLRCGSCKNVFSFIDDGRRPLQPECPHCGRKGTLGEPPAAQNP